MSYYFKKNYSFVASLSDFKGVQILETMDLIIKVGAITELGAAELFTIGTLF